MDQDESVATPETDARDLYLELLKQVLTFLLWDARDGSLYEPRGGPLIATVMAAKRLMSHFKPEDPDARSQGRDWPTLAHTMVGRPRLDSLQTCLETVLRERVPGDVIETGVWRGGASIFMRAVLVTSGGRERTSWVADSFGGLPKPNTDAYPADKGFDLSMFRSLAVSQEEVQANFARYQLLDDHVKFLPGWFRDTLPSAPIDRLALMRLDGDLYESTMDALVHLYPKLSPGGFAIIDDYGDSPPCKQAVEDYRREHAITDELVEVDWAAVYWRKGAATA